jgi:hypothetical protein
MPEPTRSASEIEFLLRNAQRRSGPAMLRDMARAEVEPPPAPAAKKPGATHRSKTLI